MSRGDNLEAIVAAKAPGAGGFSRLSAGCEGAFPTKIVEALEVLARAAGPAGAAAARLLDDARVPGKEGPAWDPRLPLPHPADLDWRFTRETADRLIDAALDGIPARGTVLAVAVPTVVTRLVERETSHRIVFAARPDDPVTTALRSWAPDGVVFIDAASDLRSVEADVSLVDPPWYDDVALPLVRQAASGTKLGGAVLVCGPDRLTGCSAAARLAELPQQPLQFGLRAARIAGRRPRYDTPLFELNTLEAAGVLNADPKWRTGRLFVGEALGPSQVGPEDVPAAPAWREHVFGTCRARLPAGAPGCYADRVEFSVRPIVGRLRGAERIPSIWTSGNRTSDALPSGVPHERASAGMIALTRAAEIENAEARSRLRPWRSSLLKGGGLVEPPPDKHAMIYA